MCRVGTVLARGAVLLLSSAGLLWISACGTGDQTFCETFCEQNRGLLINTYGVPAEQIDCGEAKWEGTCEYCLDLVEQDYQLTLPGRCAAGT